ncbi:Pectinesterase PPME1 -like protein [Gossypium arboreum]|uniref:Pectinesterase n=1 Tax=Gossypium arboreum TaxID=29729 RepID=A0A0B0PI87_GOSAR|nr:Pectinesterase PPME1 -like protein [Gossypium arboreum]
MAGKRIKGSEVYVAAICVSILLFAPIIVSQPIPADKSQINAWFNGIIKSVKERGNTLDPELVEAETKPRIIKVMQGGGGEFDTITKAIESVPSGNTKRVIVSIGPGSYKEKIRIERNKPFITLLGDPKKMPNLTFDGTAKQFGTVDSATLITECSYFVGANLNILNTAPRPDGKMVGAQAVALRVSGDRSAFYNCKIIGFQDTLCDDRGNHFFKDCHIRGTVDFIFGSGKSLYLNTEIFVEGDPGLTVITAQARESSSEDTGYSFVHGSISGTAKNAFLGRAWKSSPRVVYAYTEMGNVINPVGWSHNVQPERAKTVYYGEYKCTGQGANPKTREPFVKQLPDAEAQPFLVLDYVEATKWLLPPPTIPN